MRHIDYFVANGGWWGGAAGGLLVAKIVVDAEDLAVVGITEIS